MPIKRKPIVNNVDMPPNTFVYSDGIYDYCIVNGESLTKYFAKAPGEYESSSIHRFLDPLGTLESYRNKWMKILLKVDGMSENPKYKKKDVLLSRIAENQKISLFGYEY